MMQTYMRYFFIWWPRILSAALSGLTLAGGLRANPAAAAEPRPARDEQTALDKYVAAPDTNYSFHVVNTIRGEGFTTHVVEMISQAWLTTNEVDRPLWKHWLSIVRPDAVASSKALLLISGGANDGRVPKSANGNLAGIALMTKSVVAELKMIPNQPLVFAGDTERRKEDAIIA